MVEVDGSSGSRMRGWMAAIVAVLLVASGAPGLASTHSSLEEDPRSCGDAAEPCTLTTEGASDRLLRGVNEVDHYRFTPPANGSIVSVSLAVTDSVGAFTSLSLTLEDPDGVIRDQAFGADDLAVDAVGAPDGDWQLRVAYHDPDVLEIPPWGTDPTVSLPHGDATTAYRLGLGIEPVDHVAPVSAEGSPAPTLQFEADEQTSRLDLYYDTRTEVPTPSSWGSVIVARQETRAAGGAIEASAAAATSLYSRVPFSNTEVRTHGVTPDAVGSVEVDPQPLYSEEIHQYRVVVATDADEQQQTRLSLGIAYSGGITGIEGWLAWNGSGPAAGSGSTDRPNVAFAQGTATFAATEDFTQDGSGTAVRAGPVSAARNVTVDHEVPEDMVDAILVRAENIANHPPEPVFWVQQPDGNETRLEGETASWALNDPAEGTWSITMEEREGAEYGQMWVGAASFPLQDLRFGHADR
jgi:hypothetical protein